MVIQDYVKTTKKGDDVTRFQYTLKRFAPNSPKCKVNIGLLYVICTQHALHFEVCELYTFSKAPYLHMKPCFLGLFH